MDDRELDALDAEIGHPRIRDRHVESFRPIVDDPEQMLLVDEILEVSALAAALPPTPEVRRALVRLRNAEGRQQTHMAWQLLAASALRMADATRPRQDRDH